MNLSKFPEVQSLSVEEKLDLVDELWRSVALDIERLEVTTEEKNLLDDRWVQFSTDPSSALTIEQFQKSLTELRS